MAARPRHGRHVPRAPEADGLTASPERPPDVPPLPVALGRLRLLAADRAYDLLRPEPGELVEAGLDALLAGADSFSLRLLAGLARGEHAEAVRHFDAAVEELGLVPQDPAVLGSVRRIMPTSLGGAFDCW
ncbi:hypothetical protein ACFPM3_08340 [Streptomyces coeruleoprunus]|uniref:Bacterial transcriptional activator domain-containing protein n=1 Tax=Streptomyces coeruleoprunus TaxID=285563 RepID=A0ABV9XCW2_9ACTN